mgnify:CR=1 FL=1
MTKTILYIEDNPQNMRLVRRMLSSEGYAMLEAADGPTGISLLRQHQPDLVLVDINLPGIDGLEVTRQIKADPDLSAIPVIALTANAMYGDRERYLQSGCDGYLAKPVSRKELLSAIENFLD